MPEFIKTAEVVGNIAQRAFGVGQFVVDRLVKMDGWLHQSHFDATPVVEPANIQVYESNIIRGEE